MSFIYPNNNNNNNDHENGFKGSCLGEVRSNEALNVNVDCHSSNGGVFVVVLQTRIERGWVSIIKCLIHTMGHVWTRQMFPYPASLSLFHFISFKCSRILKRSRSINPQFETNGNPPHPTCHDPLLIDYCNLLIHSIEMSIGTFVNRFSFFVWSGHIIINVKQSHNVNLIIINNNSSSSCCQFCF